MSLGGSDVQPLSWDTRLNILIGAARGLAFLHGTQKQGFYEYFGTSDILLDGVSREAKYLTKTSLLDVQSNNIYPIIHQSLSNYFKRFKMHAAFLYLQQNC